MNFSAMSEAEYLAILNTEFEEATTPSRLRRLKDAYGFRVKTKKGKLNALGIAPIQWRRLWDAIEKSDSGFDKDAYDREQQIARREKLRDIGSIPAVSDPALRAECDAKLEVFLKTAFPKIFHIEWSEDHYQLCDSLQTAIEKGGKRAVAYQRGFGKTQFCIGAIIWGILTGRLPMVMLISKNEEEAAGIQNGIQRRLETNKQLIALYPEICWVMATLRKSAQKRSYRGNPIEVKTGELLVLPVVEIEVEVDGVKQWRKAPGSEGVIKCCGIESGSIRGSYYDRSDETTVRPKLVLLDDPQDEKSAKNPDTVKKLIEIIEGAIEGLNGPNERLAIFMPCTCIAPNDLAFQFTDRKKKETWLGIRQPALESFPTELFKEAEGKTRNLWYQYDAIRREDLALGDDEHKRATLFFVQNREAMIAGASVRWKNRVEPPFVDPVQYLVTKFLSNRASFMAEFQQDPLDTSANVAYLNESQLEEVFNGMDRGFIPEGVERVVCAVDIQEHVLYWKLVAWAPGFTGFISNWGAWPEQPPGRFDHHNVSRKISQEIARLYPGGSFTWIEEREQALRLLCRWLLEPIRQGERLIQVDAVALDARWEKIEDVCLKIAGEEEFRGRVIPCGGQFVGPNRPSISNKTLEKTQSRVDRECEWVMSSKPNGMYFVEFDADHYRTRVQTGLAKMYARKTAPGRISYNGTKGSKFLASHLAAKRVEMMEGQRRTIEHWKNKPGADQDHWLDCLVMCLVMAEHEGMRASGIAAKRPKTRTAVRQVITQADVPKSLGGR